MNLIVAVDQLWGIGLNDELQFRIKADLQNFKSLTLGKAIILGRRTLQTFPKGQPLSGRTNLILSRNPNLKIDGAIVCQTIEELLVNCAEFNPDDLFVIGGSSIYEALLPFCKRAYVTRVETICPADRFFPNLDQLPDWRCVAQGEPQIEDGLEFRFLIYDHVQQ